VSCVIKAWNIRSNMTNATNTSLSGTTQTEEKRSAFYRPIYGDISLSVILPKQYVGLLGLQRWDYVKVTEEDNRIIIEKA